MDELAEACSSPEEAVKIYTAARIAVDVDSDEEHEFLAALADGWASTTASPRISTPPRATPAEVGAPRVYGAAPVSRSRNAALNASAASYMTQWPAPSIRRTRSSG